MISFINTGEDEKSSGHNDGGFHIDLKDSNDDVNDNLDFLDIVNANSPPNHDDNILFNPDDVLDDPDENNSEVIGGDGLLDNDSGGIGDDGILDNHDKNISEGIGGGELFDFLRHLDSVLIQALFFCIFLIVF